MLNKLAGLLRTNGLWLLALLVFVVSVIVARLTGDPHWLSRGGALIAALAAGAVLLQIALEIGLERARHQIEARHGETEPLEPLSPIDRLAKRLKESRDKRQVEGIEQQRLKIAFRVVSCAMLGELLHGFGDLLACQWLVACVDH